MAYIPSMSQSISTPETAATAITKDLEICDPVINIEDSHFQLPIRRRPSISISNDEDSEAQQSIATEDMNSEATKETDSDSSQMIFTPEAGLSEDDDVELDIMEEKVTGSDDLLNQGDPTFHEAVAGGFVDLVKSCIGQGVDVDLKTKDGETPLIIAILEAQLGMASTLLECGANVHRRANGMPSIIYAAMKGAPAPPFLRLLKDWGANPSTIHGPHRYNALHWAASAGNTAAVDFLVSIGMNLEQPCSQGRTPLLIAAANGKTAVTKLLLAKGAEAKHRSHNGGTAVAWAACHGHVGTVAYLLKEGLDVEVPDSSGISPLWGASSLGSIEVVELLIQKGATINSISSQQKHSTPVMIAAAAGHADVVQILIDHGADLTITNGDGSTVLEIAIAGSHAETVGLLLEVLGGDDYPQESIAIDIAMATSILAVKSVMTEVGLIRLYTNEESAMPPSTCRGIVDQILREGGELIKPYALSNMMFTALHEKELAVVMALLAYGYDPNQYLASGQTPLHIAIVQGNIRLVEVLLEYGADPVLPSCNLEGPDYTPLHQALIALDKCQDRDTSIVDLLLETGQCRLMTGEDARSTAFDYVLSHYSMWDHGVAEIMTFRMLQFASDIPTDCSNDGSTLMHSAVWYGRADLTGILISKGLDINAPDLRGNTPFFLECHRSTRLLRFYINNGANAYAKNNDGQTALHAAASQGQIGVISFLFHLGLPINVPNNMGYMPFTWAVISGEEDAALHLLNLGAKISPEAFRPRRTLLHLAAEFNMSRLLPKFLDNPSIRTRVNSKDRHSTSPLETAARHADRSIVEALLDAGADIQGKALHMALKYGNVDAARCLIERGADVKSKSKYGYMPLHVAEDSGVMEMLIERGADVNGLDRDGLTPLFHCEDADVAQILIIHGADVHCQDRNGWTCLHRAVREGNVDIFRVLLGAGADVAVRTSDDGLDVCERIEDVEDEEVRVAFEQMVACVDV